MSDLATKSLVLGASGLTGTETVSILSQAGFAPRVTFREQSELTTLREFGTETVYADFGDFDSIKNAMTGMERVFFIAPTSPKAAEWNPIALAAAKETGIGHFIRLSGIGAKEGVAAQIAKIHYEADEALKASGIPYTIIKPTPYYQNLFWSVITIVRHGRFSLPYGNAAVAHMDVRDVARVAAHILIDDGHQNQEYTVTGPESMTMFQIARRLAKAIKRDVRYAPSPPSAAKQVFRDLGLTDWDASTIGEMFEEYSSGGYSFVTNNFEKITGQKPISFEKFCTDYHNVFLKEPVALARR